MTEKYAVWRQIVHIAVVELSKGRNDCGQSTQSAQAEAIDKMTVRPKPPGMRMKEQAFHGNL